jgi:cytochrome c-type biogenesis protein CcmH/NrfG
LGRIYLEQEEYTAAKDAFEAAIKLNPAIPAARLGLAETLIQENKLKEAGEVISNLAKHQRREG